MKRAFEVTWKTIFIKFKGLSIDENSDLKVPL